MSLLGRSSLYLRLEAEVAEAKRKEEALEGVRAAEACQEAMRERLLWLEQENVILREEHMTIDVKAQIVDLERRLVNARYRTEAAERSAAEGWEREKAAREVADRACVEARRVARHLEAMRRRETLRTLKEVEEKRSMDMYHLTNDVDLLRIDPDISTPLGVDKRRNLNKREARLKELRQEARDALNFRKRLEEVEKLDERLRMAASRGDAETALSALSKGAFVDAPGLSGARPLDLACGMGDVNMVQVCLDAGADPLGGALGLGPFAGVGLAKRDLLKKKSALTEVEALAAATSQPLIIATERNFLDVLRALLDFYPEDAKKKQLIDFSKDSKGQTALHAAARRANLPALQLFFLYKPTPNVKDKDGATPLHFAAGLGDDNVLDIIKLLIDHGADHTAQDDNGDTPQVWARRPAVIAFFKELKPYNGPVHQSPIDLYETDRLQREQNEANNKKNKERKPLDEHEKRAKMIVDFFTGNIGDDFFFSEKSSSDD